MSDDATAFVPGHVTGFFSAHPADDPAVAGSRGAGLTLSHGVTVTVEPAPETTVSLDGEAVEMPPVADVLRSLDVTAAVDAESDLPLGAGFGVSGAMALGTALAANAVFSCGRSENELVTLAHVAEVRAGTGLGDVVAQARGGMPVRVEPGAPAHGRMDGIPARPTIEYVAFGGLSTADVLSGDTTALTAAGETALEALRAEPTLDRFVAESRRFARDAGLLTDRVEAAIDDVRAAGGDSSMAMLGETVFAVGSGLSDAGYDPERCRVHPAGATLRSE
ncbi:sugar kinase [Haloferax sp. Atlit-12N]|uniref:pantoate kinase n=1 Tax=Haloferax sp. Atlit-12N TaxID=2077203 RepID=UPI000E2738F7|nr:pantoate kinase [Haloferax sp. Atlit-12N]RDZ65586.1 sugar kinase [Haloferax sp. Atlit-12N]